MVLVVGEVMGWVLEVEIASNRVSGRSDSS